MGLEDESEDVPEHLKSHEIKLNTEELQEEQQKVLADDLLSDEEEVWENAPSALINKMCEKCGEVQLFVEKSNPDTMFASSAVHIIDDNAVMHIRKIMKYGQKQLTL